MSKFTGSLHYFSGYVYMVSSLSSFTLLKITNNIDISLIPWFTNPKIFIRDDFNRLFVEKFGDEITLGVDGEILCSITDDSFRSGMVGLLVKSFLDGNYVGARFCDFKLYDLVL